MNFIVLILLTSKQCHLSCFVEVVVNCYCKKIVRSRFSLITSRLQIIKPYLKILQPNYVVSFVLGGNVPSWNAKVLHLGTEKPFCSRSSRVWDILKKTDDSFQQLLLCWFLRMNITTVERVVFNSVVKRNNRKSNSL